MQETIPPIVSGIAIGASIAGLNVSIVEYEDPEVFMMAWFIFTVIGIFCGYAARDRR